MRLRLLFAGADWSAGVAGEVWSAGVARVAWSAGVAGVVTSGLVPGSIERYIIAPVILAVLIFNPPAPSRFPSPNDAVMYLALNRVSHATNPVESLQGLVSNIATSLRTTALNGFALSPPTTIRPSIFSSSDANAFFAIAVCTAGDCTAIRTAVSNVRMAVTVR